MKPSPFLLMLALLPLLPACDSAPSASAVHAAEAPTSSAFPVYRTLEGEDALALFAALAASGFEHADGDIAGVTLSCSRVVAPDAKPSCMAGDAVSRAPLGETQSRAAFDVLDHLGAVSPDLVEGSYNLIALDVACHKWQNVARCGMNVPQVNADETLRRIEGADAAVLFDASAASGGLYDETATYLETITCSQAVTLNPVSSCQTENNGSTVLMSPSHAKAVFEVLDRVGAVLSLSFSGSYDLQATRVTCQRLDGASTRCELRVPKAE